MSKRTVGERFALSLDPEGTIHGALYRNMIAAKVDAIVRREKAKAWDECYVRICESDLVLCADLKVPRDANPYRGMAKR